jgi:hypothetical protein
VVHLEQEIDIVPIGGKSITLVEPDSPVPQPPEVNEPRIEWLQPVRISWLRTGDVDEAAEWLINIIGADRLWDIFAAIERQLHKQN